MISTMIPDRPLRWNGIPLFHVGAFPEDFSGRLFFVLGQGLGDHVNGFRILHELKQRFTQAVYIVYADLRWEELVRRMEGIEIRWYPKAKDVLSRTGTNNPYDPAHDEVREETGASPGQAYLAYAHFPMPDRHARQETTLEATARTIGLSLREKARPFLPVLASDAGWAEEFIKCHGLEKGRYAVVAPFSWPNKVWGKENFSSLIDLLLQKHGMRTVVASYPEIGSFDNEGVVCAFDLTLGQLAGLLGSAGVYVGLDSGPSHMAASFALPMVVVFVETRVIPFEVRPLSPHALLVVESFFEPVPVPKVETVADAVDFILKDWNLDRVPSCPVCARSMNYVVAAGVSAIRLMCSCGLAIDKDCSGASFSDHPREGEARSFNQSPIDSDHDLANLDGFEKWGKAIDRLSPERLEVLTGNRTVGSGTPIMSHRLMLGFDSLLLWMGSKGYTLIDCRQVSGKILVSFLKEGSASGFRSKKNTPVLNLQWGGAVTSGDRWAISQMVQLRAVGRSKNSCWDRQISVRAWIFKEGKACVCLGRLWGA